MADSQWYVAPEVKAFDSELEALRYIVANKSKDLEVFEGVTKKRKRVQEQVVVDEPAPKKQHRPLEFVCVVTCDKNLSVGGIGIWSSQGFTQSTFYVNETSNSTRTRSSLAGAIECVKSAPSDRDVVILSTLDYVNNNFSNISTWMEQDWKKVDGKPPQNVDLWKILYELQINRQGKIAIRVVDTSDLRAKSAEALAWNALNQYKRDNL